MVLYLPGRRVVILPALGMLDGVRWHDTWLITVFFQAAPLVDTTWILWLTKLTTWQLEIIPLAGY